MSPPLNNEYEDKYGKNFKVHVEDVVFSCVSNENYRTLITAIVNDVIHGRELTVPEVTRIKGALDETLKILLERNRADIIQAIELKCKTTREEHAKMIIGVAKEEQNKSLADCRKDCSSCLLENESKLNDKIKASIEATLSAFYDKIMQRIYIACGVLVGLYSVYQIIRK